MKINELVDGQKVEFDALIANVTKGVSTNAATYLNVTLQDSTGSIEAKKWDASEEDIKFYTIGKIIKVNGDVNLYRNSLQFKIASAQKVDEATIDYQDFVISAPIKKEVLETQLHEYMSMVKDPDTKLLMDALINKFYTPFLTHPAATRNHHEYCSGLLHHSVSVAKLAIAIADFYNDIDKDILIAGALLHDLGKIIELSGPIIPSYTTEGRLIGHISLMQSEIREMAHELNIKSEVPMLLEHMILSHHGKREYGSPVLPMTREALILSIADDIDAKMNILDKAYKDTNEGEFTNRIYPLEERAFYKPKKR
ncbi:MAG: HD domain-containing protein [Erysipelotrichales bacterium]|nr:HD domain-containing protein [Erysipelotrichales bacterium]